MKIIGRVKNGIFQFCGNFNRHQIEEVQKVTSFAGAERSDGLRRAGPNDFMFVYNLMHRDLSISIIFVLLVMFSIFCNLSTIHNLATYIF